MTEIQNIKPVWVIEKLRFICNLVLGTWDLIDYFALIVRLGFVGQDQI